MSTCTQVVLSGKICRERQVPTPVTQTEGYCYWHGKVFDGLTTPSEGITLLEDDD